MTYSSNRNTEFAEVKISHSSAKIYLLCIHVITQVDFYQPSKHNMIKMKDSAQPQPYNKG